MAPEMPATLVCTALQMAVVQRNPAAGLVVHSDRGTQYASAQHQELLKKHGLVGSMSHKGDCWRNGNSRRRGAFLPQFEDGTGLAKGLRQPQRCDGGRG